MSTPALEVSGLSVRFRTPRVVVRAVTDAAFALHPGRLLALVGESGCGKSVLASALLGLLPGNADVAGTAWLCGSAGDIELLAAPERVLARQVRGRRVALVPQSAHAALTPTRTARSLLAETVANLGASASVAELAERAGLADADLDRYPHELSGGMAQRVVLALALAGEPEVLIADEPTTGLDRPLADHVMSELRELADAGTAVLVITHDLAAVERVATDLAVMYATRLVEVGPAEAVLADPWHTYTADLLAALPERGFTPIPGYPPDLTRLPAGCAYALRSERHREVCDGEPVLSPVLDGTRRQVACGAHRPDGVRRLEGAAC